MSVEEFHSLQASNLVKIAHNVYLIFGVPV